MVGLGVARPLPVATARPRPVRHTDCVLVIALAVGRRRSGAGKGRVGVIESNRRRRGNWFRGVALVTLVGLALVACGDDEDEDENELDVRAESTAAMTMFDASPAAGTPGRGGLPQDATTETVTIEGGELDPELIEGQVGESYVLTVRSDAAHTFAIDGIVTETQIAANQDNLVQFTVPEQGEGDKNILIDGEEAGTFRVQEAGGVTDS